MLQQKINTWISIQQLYIPEVSILHTHENRVKSQQATVVEPYDIKLYLPSALPTNVTCSSQLQDYEFKLHEAQAFEALEDLCQVLCLHTYMFKYKDQHITRQRANTRCQNLLKRVYKRVDAAKGKYWMAQKALTILGARLGEVRWMVRLLPLKDEDVRPLRDMELELQKKTKKWKEKEKKQKGEGYIELSWIWKVVGVSSDEGNESLQEGEDPKRFFLAVN